MPHVLHNINHDVNHDFAGAIDGAFANRVYPALTVIDTALNSYEPGVSSSRRLHDEIADTNEPAEFGSYGHAKTMTASGNPILLGLAENPLLGGNLHLIVDGWRPGDAVEIHVGAEEDVPSPPEGTSYTTSMRVFPAAGGQLIIPLPTQSSFEGMGLSAQARVVDFGSGEAALSNGIRFRLSATGPGANKMGHRAGQPSRALYSPDGAHALMLNRGSEDIFLYEIAGNAMELRSVFPPRIGFVERAAFDTATPMGDLPLGMALVPDASTDNDDALLYVINESTRTLSALRVDWVTGTIHPIRDQIASSLAPDGFTASQRIGQELFEDSSRAQTTGNFNNSCASCHFEGGADGNVWQRPAGPRSTMPVYGGTLGTGLILWKGVRLNMGETGPMFGGENGGHGILTDAAAARASNDYHEIIPVPAQPESLNLTTAATLPTAEAQFGSDLFFGTNGSGLNPGMRVRQLRRRATTTTEDNPVQLPRARASTRWTSSHPDAERRRDTLATALDPSCVSHSRENLVTAINIRNVNTGVNVDGGID